MKLTATAVRQATTKDKPYKLADSNGLFLLVTAKGQKYWRYKYRFAGKEKMLALGVYPEVSLKDARQSHQEARATLANGIDPCLDRKAAKAASADINTFEGIAREWLEKQRSTYAASTYNKTLWLLESFLLPTLGGLSPNDITPPMVLAALRRIENQGKHETAHRAKQAASRVFRYAIATGRCERDPCPDLKGALTATNTVNRASITDPKQIGELLRAIDGFGGQYVTHCALRLAPLVFVRPGELRGAQWDEIDLAAAVWRIPAERMKMRTAHVVPLSRQAVAVLEELKPFTCNSRYVFPAIRSLARHMSENTINAALRRLGYSKEEMTGHGFRAMASTRLNELGWNPDIIERQLAHTERNKVRAAYNRAEHLEERRKMMQAWADYLDGLKTGADVVPIRRA
jgi:integrase